MESKAKKFKKGNEKDTLLSSVSFVQLEKVLANSLLLWVAILVGDTKRLRSHQPLEK